MYLVCRLRRWEDERGGCDLLPFEISITPSEGEIGYCPVYDDYDKALEYAGKDELVLEIEAREDTCCLK